MEKYKKRNTRKKYKKRNIRIIFTAIISAMILAVALCACSDSIDGTVGGDNTESSESTESSEKNTVAEEQTTAGGTSIADLEAVVDGLKGTIAELESKVSGLDEKIKAIEGGTGSDELKASLEQLRKDTGDKIEEISKSVDALSANIASQDWVNETFATLEENKAALDDIALIRTDIDTVNSAISDLETDIADKVAQINDIISNLAEKSELEEQISDITNEYTSAIENAREEICNDYMTEISDAIASSEQTIKDWVRAEYDGTIYDILFRIDELESENENLVIRVNCLEGNHVVDTTATITYTWSDDFSTCTANGTCKHCGADVSETADSTISGYTYSALFTTKEFSSQTCDLTDLTNMTATLQENALSVIFETKPSTLTLNLPKDFNSFSLINDPIKGYDEGKYIDLTLNGVERIADRAFEYNTHLKSINLPDVTQIGNSAFYDCEKLMNISARKVEKIDYFAFFDCTSLTEIELPKVTAIGPAAFGDTYIERIKFGAVITEIELDIFSNVDTAKCVLIFAEGQKKFVGSDKDRWKESDEAMTSSDTVFLGKTFKKIFVGDIPECTTHDTEIVYKWSVDFNSCTAVSECKNCFRAFADETVSGDKISLEGFVYTAMFENALFGTTTLDLTDLTNFNESQYEERLEFVFSQKNANVTLMLPESFNQFDQFVLIRNKINTNYEYGTLSLSLRGIKTIPNNAFSGCKALKSIDLVDVIEIGDNAFKTCTKLTEITANNVTKIGANAFYQCMDLTNVNIPNVTEVGDQAFYWCLALKELTFGSASMKIGANAFEACYNLEKIEFKGIIAEIGADMFKDATPTNCTLILANGQENFTQADDGSFTLTGTDVVAGTNAEFCGYTFKEIKFAD